jgi:precorrin-6A/cobalt-precorrin-6A reductase
MRAHGTRLLVSKNSGGTAAAGKLAAARRLALPVLMVDRPPIPDRLVLDEVEAVLAWLNAHRSSP